MTSRLSSSGARLQLSYIVVNITIFSVERSETVVLTFCQTCWLSCHAYSLELVVVISTVVSLKFRSFFHHDDYFLALEYCQFFISTRQRKAWRGIAPLPFDRARQCASNGRIMVDFDLLTVAVTSRLVDLSGTIETSCLRPASPSPACIVLCVIDWRRGRTYLV